jgi:hypothetical protein
MRLLAAGAVEVEALVEGVYPLELGLDAFEHASTRGALKVLLSID